jgi:voltage-gated potassium channel
VTENSPLANKTLREAKIPEETGMWVLAIKRGDKCIRPKPDTRIQAGDILIASGYAEGEEDLKKLAAP